ncbi:MAG: hypothetical protein DRR19_10865 [Candidatus Parabeggiatoa sp. nov. 1]|nr:MAG: hypothetical protein DRR19_10865 [Gammaproteobacteria bacterium]
MRWKPLIFGRNTIVETLEIRFLSDWHIGEGSGQPGHIDKLVRRHPQDGLPYVPAKTITGIWRDACEQVAAGLDFGNANGPWQAWVTVLFGNQPTQIGRPEQPKKEYREMLSDISPQSACLTIRAARFPNSLRQQLAGCPPLKESLTFIKPGIRIDPKTGQAIDGHLHFDEIVRAGAILESPIYIEGTFTQTQQQVAYALLWAGAKAVARLGGKRRRGLGRCQFKFNAISKEDALNILKQNDVPTCPEPSLDKVHQFTSHDSASQTDDWVQVPLHLTLKTPVIVPQGEAGNLVKSLDYIPGTHLLGAVTKLLRQSTKVDLFSYVAKGDIQVSHAYQEVSNTRGLPVPKALFYEKYDNSGQVYNRLMKIQGYAEKAAQLKQHREGYIITFDKPIGEKQHLQGLFTTPLQLTTHSTIEDNSGRPAQERDGVFIFEAIKTGTRLQSVLKMRKFIADKLKAANENWWEVLNANIRVGKSKKDDYGWVSLKAEHCQQTPTLPTQSPDKQLTVWLCTDLLLRDARLRPSTDLADLQKELEKQLGVELRTRKENDDTLSALIRTNRTEGWHQRWGQPRPSYIGLVAGSCIVFECQSGRLEPKQLQALMRRGLGERRAEGFGEVRFNPPLLMQALSELPRLEANNFLLTIKQRRKTELAMTSDSQAFVKILETAAWREDIRRAAVAISVNTKIRRQTFDWRADKPPNNQLGALRTVLNQMQTLGDKPYVLGWLDHLCGTANRKDKWTDKGLKIVYAFLKEPQLIWDELQKSTHQSGLKHLFPTLRTEAKASLEKELWAEAVRTLFAVAIRYEKRERDF